EAADGDQIMALLARRWAAEGRLREGVLVAPVMSNLGLERNLEANGLRLERTAVGDRYVVERMRQGGWNLGGEQSGHIVMTDYATTGDGLIAALQFLAAMVESGLPASRLVRSFEPVPQMLRNVRYSPGADPLTTASVRAAVAAAETRLQGTGRLLIRRSGTEPLIRVMAEAEDADLLADVVGGIVSCMEATT
ncbi:MAG: phosphoglucosamine mutase, partial [Rhodobacteraceae bacterium]|nr:phosphoglucosamine mutase [Paracoccaceae bacterium]